MNPQKFAVRIVNSAGATLMEWTWSDYWKEGWYKDVATGEAKEMQRLCATLNKSDGE